MLSMPARMAMPTARAAVRAALMAITLLPLATACRCGTPYGESEHRGAIDFHTHIAPSASQAMRGIMTEADVALAINLSAAPTGPALARQIQEGLSASPRLLVFAGVDWRALWQDDFGERAARDLKQAVALGARGLKVSKALGLVLRGRDGALIAVDDARLDPLWKAAGSLGVPVAIHTGDPLAFFEAPTEENERIEELRDHPSWSFFGEQFPSLQQLLAARDRLVARHPETTFVAVHVGGFPENLQSVAASMRALPNMWIDVAARIPELGRQQVGMVRSFFEEFQDRIVLGTDLQASGRRMVLGSAGDDERATAADAVAYYRLHWRYFETDDVEFEHLTPIQGRWPISAIGLSRDVLDKLYRDNAVRLLGL